MKIVFFNPLKLRYFSIGHQTVIMSSPGDWTRQFLLLPVTTYKCFCSKELLNSTPQISLSEYVKVKPMS